jgi:hypothetical protein
MLVMTCMVQGFPVPVFRWGDFANFKEPPKEIQSNLLCSRFVFMLHLCVSAEPHSKMAPKLRDSKIELIQVSQGKEFTLNCIAQASPAPMFR